jgi:ribosomal protein L23
MNIYNIIKKPVVTEKATSAAAPPIGAPEAPARVWAMLP